MVGGVAAAGDRAGAVLSAYPSIASSLRSSQ